MGTMIVKTNISKNIPISIINTGSIVLAEALILNLVEYLDIRNAPQKLNFRGALHKRGYKSFF